MHKQDLPPKGHPKTEEPWLTGELISFLTQFYQLRPELQPLVHWVVVNADLLPRLLPAEHISGSTLDELITLATQRKDHLLLVLALCARYIKEHPASPCV